MLFYAKYILEILKKAKKANNFPHLQTQRFQSTDDASFFNELFILVILEMRQFFPFILCSKFLSNCFRIHMIKRYFRCLDDEVQIMTKKIVKM